MEDGSVDGFASQPNAASPDKLTYPDQQSLGNKVQMKQLKQHAAKVGGTLHWQDIDPDDHGPFDSEEAAFEKTEEYIRKLDRLQERLYAEGTRALLIVLQGMDTSGKDGLIRHVIKGINPQGCQVTSFKVPTPEERGHDFLWRIHQHVPAKGYIGIFNRSHYEDVLVTRVHGLITGREAKRRFQEINDFEAMLVQSGTTIVKFWLTISKDEQRERLQARLDDPHKHWKYNPDDLKERRYWDLYSKAYTDAVSATATKHAPWYLIPANRKWYRNHLVAKILVGTLEGMNLQYPASIGGLDYAKIVIPK